MYSIPLSLFLSLSYTHTHTLLQVIKLSLYFYFFLNSSLFSLALFYFCLSLFLFRPLSQILRLPLSFFSLSLSLSHTHRHTQSAHLFSIFLYEKRFIFSLTVLHCPHSNVIVATLDLFLYIFPNYHHYFPLIVSKHYFPHRGRVMSATLDLNCTSIDYQRLNFTNVFLWGLHQKTRPFEQMQNIFLLFLNGLVFKYSLRSGDVWAHYNMPVGFISIEIGS